MQTMTKLDDNLAKIREGKTPVCATCAHWRTVPAQVKQACALHLWRAGNRWRCDKFTASFSQSGLFEVQP